MSALVFLIGLLALLGVCRRKKDLSPKWRTYRSEVLFWCVAGMVAWLLALGKYGPLYWLVYKLPKFSAMRNPVKFLYAFEICTVFLFAYGVEYFTDTATAEDGDEHRDTQQATTEQEAQMPARSKRRRKRGRA